MIRPIVEQIIRPIIESNLSWVTKFGGVAVLAEKQLRSGDTYTYPVSVTSPSDCPPGKEPILSPDDRESAILWVEETSDAVGVIDPRIAKRGGMQYTQSIKILGWVNGLKLGEGGYQFSYSPEEDLIRVLQNTRLNNAQLTAIGVGDDLPIARLTISVTGKQAKDHRVIFSAYSFSDGVEEQKYFTHPFDYFAIDLEIQWLVLENCIPAFAPGAALPCPPQGTGGGFVIVSDCAGNLINKGSDGGACLVAGDLPPAPGDGNGMFDVANEGGAWLVSNVTSANGLNVSSQGNLVFGDSQVTGASTFGVIIGGSSNTILDGISSAIVGGSLNTIDDGFGHFVFGGNSNRINGSVSNASCVIAGGQNNTLTNVNSSIILGGDNIAPTIVKNRMAYVPSLSIWDIPLTSTSIDVLIRDATDEGEVKRMPLISTDANNAVSQGIDGGVFLDGSTVGANGMFDVVNEGGAWLVTNVTSAAGLDVNTPKDFVWGAGHVITGQSATSRSLFFGSSFTIDASANSAIIGGVSHNLVRSDGSVILGSQLSALADAPNCAIIGAQNAALDNVTGSVIIGGAGIIPSNPVSNQVYVPSLVIWQNPSVAIHTHVLITDSVDEGLIKEMPLISTDATNTATQGSDGGVFVAPGGGGGDNGMFGAVNEAGTWLVSNFTIGPTMTTQALDEEWKIGFANTERYISFSPTASTGIVFNLVDESGSAFSIIKSNITNTLFTTDDAFMFQVNGQSNLQILQTQLQLKKATIFETSLLDTSSSAGTAGQVLSSLGGTAGVQWINAAGGGGGGGMFDAANQGGTWAVTSANVTAATILNLSGSDGLQFTNIASPTIRFIKFGFFTDPLITLTANNVNSLVIAGQSTESRAQIYVADNAVGLRLGGTDRDIVHIYCQGALGQVDFPQYGLGNFGGTTAYPLAIQSDGQVIEGPATGFRNGVFDLGNQGGTWAVTNLTLGGNTVITEPTDSSFIIESASPSFAGAMLSVKRVQGGRAIFFTLEDTAITHGITGLAPTTNTVGMWSIWSSAQGGFQLRGLSQSDSVAAGLIGTVGTSGTTTAPAIVLQGTKKAGTGQQALTGADILLEWQTTGNIFGRIRGNGDFEFLKYGVGAKEAIPIYSLGVDSSGKMVEFLGVGPTTNEVQGNNVTTFYDNDAAAAVGGIGVNELYALSSTNTYGETFGVVKVRTA